jgi:hypothetical protein
MDDQHERDRTYLEDRFDNDDRRDTNMTDHITAAQRTREVAGDIMKTRDMARRHAANKADPNADYWEGRLTGAEEALRLLEDIDGCARADRRDIERLTAERNELKVALEDMDEETEAAFDRVRSSAFVEGMNLGASVENRVASDAIVAAALAILGKDRADGEIDLGALGKHFAA